MATIDGRGVATARGNGAAQVSSTANDVEGRAQAVVRAGPLHWESLHVGLIHTCALSFQDDAYCWGNSTFGEGGYGENVSVQTEVTAVSGGHRFGGIAVGGSHACGVTPDGEAYCWGANRQGRLGEGTTTDRSIPARVESDLTFILIAAGSTFPVQDHTCGLAGNGTAYCWGSNEWSQLGGSSPDRSRPAKLPDPGDIAGVSG